MICDLYFDRMDIIGMLKDPTTGKEVHKRKGFHSGPVVREVVGLQIHALQSYKTNLANPNTQTYIIKCIYLNVYNQMF